jgi:FixJ family two-component response regulator
MNLLPAVFVVDDEAAIQRSLTELLDVWNVRVHSFSSAEAFLESYQEDWTGCLLIDLRMPGMNGLGLLKELRRRGCSLPALLMTGHGERELQQQAIECGACGLLEKPYRVEQLIGTLERHCPEFFRSAKWCKAA